MAFATKDDVLARLEDEPTAQMLVMIEAGLEEATDLAIYYGANWTDDNAPDPVRRIVARAVARWIRNPEGLQQSRAADETLAWSEDNARGEVMFTPEEIERVRALGSPVVPSFGSARVAPDYVGSGSGAFSPYVPVAHGGRPFPFLVQEFPNRPVFE